MTKGITYLLTMLSALFWANGAFAQTYNQMTWGIDKTTNPYTVSTNLNGTWYQFATVSPTGTWAIPSSTLCYCYTGISYDQLGNPYTSGVMSIGSNNFTIQSSQATKQNVALGISNLTNITTGFQNTSIGNYNLTALTTGYGNVAVGSNTFNYTTTGVFNTGVGTGVLRYLDDTSGVTSGNVGLGHGAMAGDDFAYYANTGSANTAIGAWAMQELTSGLRNTAVGTNAGLNLLTGSDNVFVGWRANVCSTDAYRVHLPPPGCPATGVVAIGSYALESNIANQNVGVGYFALNKNTTGLYNLAVGGGALKANTTGYANIALGENSLPNMLTGNANLAIGVYALQNAATSVNVIAIGNGAGNNVSSGSGSVLIGVGAGQGITTESGNTFIGNLAGQAATGISNSIALGASSVPTASNQIMLGNSSSTNLSHYGVHQLLTKYTLAGLPACSATNAGAFSLVSNGVTYLVQGVGTAAGFSGTGTSIRPVICANALDGVTYQWIYY